MGTCLYPCRYMSLHMDVCLYAHELAWTHTWVFLPVCARLHMPICACAFPWLFSLERGQYLFHLVPLLPRNVCFWSYFFLKKLFLKFALLCHASFLHLRHLFSTSSGNRLEEKEEEERDKGSFGHKQRLLNPVTLLAWSMFFVLSSGGKEYRFWNQIVGIRILAPLFRSWMTLKITQFYFFLHFLICNMKMKHRQNKPRKCHTHKK